MSLRMEALRVLNHHGFTPESVLPRLQEEPILTLRDAENMEWTFVTRHRCRRYLMAKTPLMNRFEEVYCKQ